MQKVCKMNMQSKTSSRKIIVACLLIVFVLSGCSSPALTPTATSKPVTNPSDIINPPQTPSSCIDITVSNTSPKVGDVVSVVGTLNGVVKPNYWGLEVKDAGADASSMLINLMGRSPNKPADISKIIKMVSAERDADKAVIGLEVTSAGTTEINYFVSAEDFCGAPLGQGVSPRIKITVNP